MPGRFKDLTELSFNGGRFQRDFELVHIQSLRQLKKLSFEATGVGNEAFARSFLETTFHSIVTLVYRVFLLVSLKENLETLHLSFNLKIDDDAIPAIILLKELEFLSIYGTSIGMPGLRKLTQTIIEEGRTPAVEIPEACEKYIDSGAHSFPICVPLCLKECQASTSSISGIPNPLWLSIHQFALRCPNRLSSAILKRMPQLTRPSLHREREKRW